MATTGGFGPDWNHKSATPFGSPSWISGAQVPELLSARFPVHYQEAGEEQPGLQVQLQFGWFVRSRRLTCCTTTRTRDLPPPKTSTSLNVHHLCVILTGLWGLNWLQLQITETVHVTLFWGYSFFFIYNFTFIPLPSCFEIYLVVSYCKVSSFVSFAYNWFVHSTSFIVSYKV